jgi:tape measure domain-containing protein
VALDFQLNLTGSFAATLAPINKGLGDANKNLPEAKKNAALFEAELGKMKSTVGGLSLDFSSLSKGGSLFSFNIADGIAAAVSVVTSLASAVIDLGRSAIKSSAAYQDLNLAVKLTAGDKAEAVNRLADSFSNTRFDDDEVKKALLPLLDAGIRDVNVLDDMATAAADISARQNTGLEGFQSALDAFKTISIKREVSSKQLVGLGINEKDFYKSLAEDLGVSAERAKALAEKGKLSSEDLLHTAYKEIAVRQGGALGVAALEGGKTLGATLRRLENLPNNLLKQLADGEGMKTLQGVLDNFIEVMSGDQGKQLMAEIGNLLADATKFMLGFLSNKDGLRAMGETMKGVVETVRDAVKWYHELLVQFQGFTKAVYAFGGFAKKVGLGPVLTAEADAKKNEISAQMPMDLLDGLNKGLAKGQGEGKQAGADMIGAVAAGADEKAERHSPSRLFARLGMDLARGMAVGMDDSAPRDAARRMVNDAVMAPPKGAALDRLATATSSSVRTIGDISIAVTLPPGQRDESEGQAVQRIAQAVRVEVRKIFEEAA